MDLTNHTPCLRFNYILYILFKVLLSHRVYGRPITLEKDNTDKVVKYIDELKSMSIELLPPGF